MVRYAALTPSIVIANMEHFVRDVRDFRLDDDDGSRPFNLSDYYRMEWLIEQAETLRERGEIKPDAEEGPK